MNVTLTCSFSSRDSACSLEGTGSQIVPLLACKLDVTAHLLSLGVSSGQNRAGYFVATEDEKMSMTIYPSHRKN